MSGKRFTNRSWAKGTNNAQGYYEGPQREAAKMLRLLAHRFLTDRANAQELSVAAKEWLQRRGLKGSCALCGQVLPAYPQPEGEGTDASGPNTVGYP